LKAKRENHRKAIERGPHIKQLGNRCEREYGRKPIRCLKFISVMVTKPLIMLGRQEETQKRKKHKGAQEERGGKEFNFYTLGTCAGEFKI